MIRTALLALALLLPGAGCAGLQNRDAAETAVRCVAAHPELAKWAQDPAAARVFAEAYRGLIRNAVKSMKAGTYEPTPDELARLNYAFAMVRYVRDCLKPE